MYAACFGLYLDHPQSCQYKSFTKKDTVESKGPPFTVTGIIIMKHKLYILKL